MQRTLARRARNNLPLNFLAVKLPTPSQHTPPPPVQVPYLPHFWNSARSAPEAPLEPRLPKLHVVAGSVTHYDDGPTHNLEKLQEDTSPTVQVYDPPLSQHVGLWADFCESLGLPRSFSVRRSLSEARNIAEQAANGDVHSRPLTDEERKGLYILLGIVGASWLVGGLVDRPTAVAEEYGTHTSL